MTKVVEVRTPGRLHFGLSSFGDGQRQFGGLGLMVDGVGIVLRASHGHEFSTSGPHAQRVREFATRWANYCQSSTLPACRVEILTAPPDHIGLGIGTQLGLAVAAALSELFAVDYADAITLAQMSGRGRRSAIGTHGFLLGGLLVDAGKLPTEPLGRLENRIEMPSDWRIVLIRESSGQGLAGEEEHSAISSLPPVPSDVTTQLRSIINNDILPAAKHHDFQTFSKSLYRYGHLAGQCFAPAQGGPFASPAIAKLVEKVRAFGHSGVGQSSWGPTVFVITESQADAELLIARLREDSTYREHHIKISSANNDGAAIKADP